MNDGQSHPSGTMECGPALGSPGAFTTRAPNPATGGDTVPRPHDSTYGGFVMVGLVAVLAGGWFGSRMSPGIALRAGQDALLADARPPGFPVLDWQIVRLIRAIAAEPLLWWHNVATVLFATAACAVLAALTAAIARRFLPGATAFLAGAVAALAYAVSPSVTALATAGNTSQVSLLLALAAVYFVVRGFLDEPAAASPTWPAMAAGLATANHAAFGWLFPFVLFYALTRPGPVARRVQAALAASLVFSAIAAWPLIAALRGGETIEAFLAHALRAPYPAMGEGAVPWAAIVAWLDGLPRILLVFAGAGLAVAGLTAQRWMAFLLICLGVLFGPMLPVLTHTDTNLPAYAAQAAPGALAAALVSVLAALGATGVAFLGAGSQGYTGVRTACGLAISLLVLALAGADAPTRRHHGAEQLGTFVLESCPDSAFLVTGDPRLVSVVSTLQRRDRLRTDVTVVPVFQLEVEAYGDVLAQRLTAAQDVVLTADGAFDSRLHRWEQEQPGLAGRLKRALERGDDVSSVLTELAVWEFVRTHFVERPVHFVAVPSEWLAARAGPCGAALVYPRPEAETPCMAFTDWLRAHLPAVPQDDDLEGALTNVLLPLSSAHRVQGDAHEAEYIAGLAALFSPNRSQPRWAAMQVAARLGERESVMNHALAYLERVTPGAEAHDAAAELEAGLAVRDVAARCAAFDPAENSAWREALLTDLTELWRHDEFLVLADTYSRIADAQPGDVDAWYQLAAALTQLGDLEPARTALGRAFGQAPGPVLQRLQQDGRFALLMLSRGGRLETILQRLNRYPSEDSGAA